MGKPSLVYVTYIETTPEQLWEALVKTDITRQYWAAHENVSDWKPGSRWEHRRVDPPGKVDIVGKVIESTPPRRLVLSWARPKDAEDQAKHSRVTFEIEPRGATVRLTVLHEDLESDPDMLKGVSKGWPQVLSNLKTFLETGRSMPASLWS